MAIVRPKAIDDALAREPKRSGGWWQAAFLPREECAARAGEESCRTPLRQRRSRRSRPSARSSHERPRGSCARTDMEANWRHAHLVSKGRHLGSCNDLLQRRDGGGRPEQASCHPFRPLYPRRVRTARSNEDPRGPQSSGTRDGPHPVDRSPDRGLGGWHFRFGLLISRLTGPLASRSTRSGAFTRYPRQRSSPQGRNGGAGSSAADERGPKGDAQPSSGPSYYS